MSNVNFLSSKNTILSRRPQIPGAVLPIYNANKLYGVDVDPSLTGVIGNGEVLMYDSANGYWSSGTGPAMCDSKGNLASGSLVSLGATGTTIYGCEAGSNATSVNNSVAVGFRAGFSGMGNQVVAVGASAGYTNQHDRAISVGAEAGLNEQSSGAIAIGYQAGYTGQGTGAVAIGYQAGYTAQHSNSVIINAGGSVLNSEVANALYVNPIRAQTSSTGPTGSLYYDLTTKEIAYDAGKSFVIDHPTQSDKYLVHTCLEGPEVGVYYRGKGEIDQEGTVQINLPEYVDKLADDFTVTLTPIENGESQLKPRCLSYSEVNNNSFTVQGYPGEFSWVVYGKRSSVQTEPFKSKFVKKGNGPYTWLESL